MTGSGDRGRSSIFTEKFLATARRAAVAAALEAGNYLVRQFGKRQAVGYKGAINLVTTADRQAERRIVRRIKKVFPDHSISAEEAEKRDTGSEFRWLIDPLDGTTNYAHGLPIYCVAIGLERSGEIILGVVYNPNLAELFLAVRGRGATLNGQRLRISTTRRLDRSLLATGFPYDIRTSKKNNLEYFRRFALSARAVRRCGAAALDMCYVACGRFDGFWELKLAPWDVAAASLVVAEAGGTLTDFSGGPFAITKSEVVASNGKIHRQMLAVLGR